ncbi:MAG TPA: hypothetical protein VEB40_07745, partial [Flavipsychrobacter sp.]|nr:hypothetical protein [Flavipsychrobacter sp.]
MSVTAMVSIQVEDYAKWKAAFDGAAQMRTNMGIAIKGIYQSAEDEKSVTIISEYPSREVAEGIMANPAWEENQRKSGVIGGFDTKFFHSVN